MWVIKKLNATLQFCKFSDQNIEFEINPSEPLIFNRRYDCIMFLRSRGLNEQDFNIVELES